MSLAINIQFKFYVYCQKSRVKALHICSCICTPRWIHTWTTYICIHKILNLKKFWHVHPSLVVKYDTAYTLHILIFISFNFLLCQCMELTSGMFSLSAYSAVLCVPYCPPSPFQLSWISYSLACMLYSVLPKLVNWLFENLPCKLGST